MICLVCICSICLLVLSCKSMNSGKRVDALPVEISKKIDQLSFLENTDSYGIYFVNESGCIACNKAFLKFVVDSISNRRNMIIFNAATGTRLDISPFLSDTIKNVVNANDDDLIKYDLYDASYFMYIRDHFIDTTIRIELERFDETIEYILQLPIFKTSQANFK
jgi:hypothetical protein